MTACNIRMRVELTPKILHISNTFQTMGSVQHNIVVTVKMVDVKQCHSYRRFGMYMMKFGWKLVYVQ